MNEPLFDYIANYIELTEEEKELLSLKLHHRKYLKGQYVVQQGDICKHESFVLSGALKTFHLDNQGQEHVVAFAIENWWTADLGSLISQSPADYNVQCLENTELIQIAYNDLQELYKALPKLERFFRIIIEKAFVSSQKRIASNLSLTAKERYLNFKKHYPQIEQRVPQYLIASYIGITKEFLSTVRNQLASE